MFTEITDVENEVNGLLTYDRRIFKVDALRLRGAHDALLNESRQLAGQRPFALGQFLSLQVVSPGFTDRFVRHLDGLGFTNDARDGTALFNQDATFCASAGLSGSGTSFESLNFAGRFIRHGDAQLWLAPGAGGATWLTTADFKADASWLVVSPWAP